MTEDPTAPLFGALPPGHRSGFVSIVGRPNVGKSTLLNAILGRKIAIVTPKPQTTRRRLLGIKTRPLAQILFVDTPGIHQARDLLNERMVEQAVGSLPDADAALFVVDATVRLNAGDRAIAALLPPPPKPVLVGLNKIDACPKQSLLPLMAELDALLPAGAIVPVSALTGENIDTLLDAIEPC
ncbi:MAG: GTPase Era, partial [bacterium]